MAVVEYIVFLGVFMGVAVGLLFGLRGAKIL
ncbi:MULTISPECIES: cytochrome b6-f complex subunit PetL [Nostocales]|jgi:cytochrome b6-f complex subunit 6|uniref:Cytochrome B6 n=5 Tax=Aphanizomenonaceae TaxID=1892259 RepID=A0A2S6CUV0_9CYAN|nr:MULTISPECIES: cytochrome b6-f complex subunit PetL [Nostocales]MBJ7295303.1 cytochrome b6-f complex subunit PetL [Dolichospermum sp.]MBO1046474.1 cytochrome b6-f complex subunit PetL [Dolichospermum sp. DEX182a]MBO1051964.1 cytochrome b6-f complex subunit PetL [Dolichospermum sp. DET73]MBS9391009.1 cytochrome b6-f complex subunit PetL [Dolichospermum sp. WA123]MCE2698352.1 cytochrome b6-f complex subunit PetL [Anabaena sp. 49633_E8]MDB9460622.1 cytochrome b6-f complex subunit PetL [Dolicho